MNEFIRGLSDNLSEDDLNFINQKYLLSKD